MSIGSWIFVIVFVLGFVTLLLLWAAFNIAYRFTRWAVRCTMLTEHIGTVVDRRYSQPRVEEDWLYCLQLSDPCTLPWMTMEPPVLVHRNVPALPHILIRRTNGDESWHECTAGEYVTWTNGTLVQIDVYAILGWTFCTSEPKLAA